MSIGHVFPLGVLVAIIFVGGGTGDGGARARARCELWLLLCSVAVTTLLGLEVCLKVLEQKP